MSTKHEIEKHVLDITRKSQGIINDEEFSIEQIVEYIYVNIEDSDFSPMALDLFVSTIMMMMILELSNELYIKNLVILHEGLININKEIEKEEMFYEEMKVQLSSLCSESNEERTTIETIESIMKSTLRNKELLLSESSKTKEFIKNSFDNLQKNKDLGLNLIEEGIRELNGLSPRCELFERNSSLFIEMIILASKKQ